MMFLLILTYDILSYLTLFFENNGRLCSVLVFCGGMQWIQKCVLYNVFETLCFEFEEDSEKREGSLPSIQLEYS